MLSRRKWLKRASGLLVPAMPFLMLPRKSTGQNFGFSDLALMASTKRSGASAYAATATTFDGSTNSSARGANLTGNADGKTGIASVWFNLNSSGGSTNRTIISDDLANFSIVVNSSNKIVISDGTASILSVTSSNTPSNSVWHHLLASWNVASSLCYLYIDDVDRSASVTTTNANIPYSTGTSDHYLSKYVTGVERRFYGCLCEVYVNFAAYLDITQASNRRLFDDGTTAPGKPISLGATGNLPTGSAPIMYFNTLSTSIGTNAGTGGNFTGAGSFTSCTAP